MFIFAVFFMIAFAFFVVGINFVFWTMRTRMVRKKMAQNYRQTKQAVKVAKSNIPMNKTELAKQLLRGQNG